MIAFLSGLYERLLLEIRECEQSPDSISKIECCFHRCESTALLVEKQISSAVFRNREEEVQVFKLIKPRFTGLVEFYSLLYKLEVFAPESEKEKPDVWDLELKKAIQFLDNNSAFVEYLRSGDISRDEELFLRASPGTAECISDRLLAQIAGREKYVDFLKEKLRGQSG